MKKTTGVIAVAGMFAIAFASSMAGYIFGANADEKIPEENGPQYRTQQISENEMPEGKDPIGQQPYEKTEIRQRYVVVEQNGKIAIVMKNSAGDEKIYKTYDISVELLPQSDREALKRGVETESLSDALQLIEDYS